MKNMLFPIPALNSFLKKIGKVQKLNSVWGQMGVGKTYFALQTALLYTEKGKKVLYLYTKPRFPSQQLGSLVKKYKKKRQKILEKLTFLQVIEYDEFFNLLFNLEFLFLKQKKNIFPKTSLLIIDNIINLYQLELNPQKKEINVDLNYSLNQLLGLLFSLKEEYKFDILLINNLSYAEESENTIELPAGGKVIDYWIPYSIKIQRTEKMNQRKFLVKTPENSKVSEKQFIFNLTDKGFV